MNHIFSQPKLIYKISFITKYKHIEIFEDFFPENILGTSMYEVESTTIDSEADDLWALEVFIENKDDIEPIITGLEIYAKNHNLYFHTKIDIIKIEDKDWVTEYQKQLKPVIIGDFFITAKSGNISCPSDKTPIYIEASRAFGTGDHATTSLCIDAITCLEEHQINTVFDIGTGSGILSFVAEKIWSSARILACDIEEISVQLAKENGITNNSGVHFYQNTARDLSIGENNRFDLIVSNILAVPLIAMAKTIRSISHENTIIILSGFLDYQLPDLIGAYNEVGFYVLANEQKDKWVVLTLKVSPRVNLVD